MTPSTNNTPPVFITERPDWNKQVLVDRATVTSIFSSGNATEQRQRRRQKSKLGISYNIEALSPPEAFAREISILQELQAPVIIPLWPYSHAIVSVAGQVINLGEDISYYPFRVGGWCMTNYLNADLFWPITGVDFTNGLITVTGSLPVLTGGTIWACIKGTRRDGSAIISFQHTESSETITVDEL